MVYKEHLIEIQVNGSILELTDQKSVNIRFQNVLTDPTQISVTQAEYSFSFDVPCTPHNNVIFDYANNLARENKFHHRYKAEVYADGIMIFQGSLTLNSVSKGMYNCNLVSVKVYSLDEIFGEKTMDKIRPLVWNSNGTIAKNEDGTNKHQPWEITFNGVTTINNMNSSYMPDAFFPTVAYGVFQKSPSATTQAGNEYTSKFDMDEWNRWYVESFPPSHNVLQTLKYAFETVDYAVGGDVFQNPYLQYIYMSDNYADGQDPEYNVGNPRFGKISASLQAVQTGNTGYEQELKFPYFQVNCVGQGYDSITSQTEYNFNAVRIYDLLGSGNTVTVNNTPNYMYQPNEGIIVVPADGFYQIEMRANATLTSTGTITAKQWLVDMVAREMSDDTDVTMDVGLDEATPIEIALIRNYDDDYELIKGKNNKQYIDGNPTHEYYEISGQRRDNIRSFITCFPHEDLYNSRCPTEDNDLLVKMPRNGMGGKRTGANTSETGRDFSEEGSGNDITSESGNFSGWRGGTRGGDSAAPIGGASTSRVYRVQDLGYVYRDGDNMCFDQAVSENFICGLSSMSGGITAVMKNGYSWSKANSNKNEIFNTELGYLKMKSTSNGGIEYEDSKLNFNTYINTPNNYCTVSGNKMNGYVSCMAYLRKNDVLRLVAVHRAYDAAGSLTPVNYDTSVSAGFTITAFSPRSYDKIKASKDNEYYRTTEFSDKLNLANFLNKETKIADWVQNIADAFNLDIIQGDKAVQINTRKKRQSSLIAPVSIDGRANSANAVSSAIDYPRSMSVKYKIDTDEWGFERSAVAAAGGDEAVLDNDDWMKYGDSGYTPIMLNDDSWVTTTSDKNLNFSYNWYDDFKFYQCNNQYQRTSNTPVTLKLPVISKFTYMIDGYNYDESMKHDGFAQPQRFWVKNTPDTGKMMWTRTYPPEAVSVCIPRNQYKSTQYGSYYLSYKTSETSILDKFFDIHAYLASNYVEIDVYLTADEYNRIKNGSYVQFDDDLYIPVEINGYDCTGYNATTLKMMKKVV